MNYEQEKRPPVEVIQREAYLISTLEVIVVTKKKTLRPEIERFKHILIEAYQRGELSTNITAKDMVRELVHQLKPIFKGNNHK
ncbi:hypothetical protein ABET52_04300 [Saccharococcus caldoxylosilyticus]|uniref:hypothetical protein n=1 Tax=Saccharococcus caldoxylosilyticus TaxID=81408 RepID=UPI003D346465